MLANASSFRGLKDQKDIEILIEDIKEGKFNLVGSHVGKYLI